MSFTLPTFNLSVNVFTGVFPFVTPRVVTTGNLTPGRRVMVSQSTAFLGAAGDLGPASLLLLPAGTDIRDASCNNLPDVVEVPAGSGRWYQVGQVDDIGKGFANEHRYANVMKLWQNAGGISCAGLFWPTPIP